MSLRIETKDDLGHMALQVKITPDHLTQAHSFEFEIDQSYLPALVSELVAVEVRRDLQLFILLTGLRSTDAKTVRWEDVNLGSGTIHRPRPKGGEDHAFTEPVAGAVKDIRQPSTEHLRAQAERVASFLLERMESSLGNGRP